MCSSIRMPLLLLIAALFLCACHKEHDSLNAWTAGHSRTHPLVGKVYDVQAEQLITHDSLLTSISKNSIVLIGEKHGHPDHHRIQANVFRTLHTLNPKLSLVTEACTIDKTKEFQDAVSQKHFDVSRLPESSMEQQPGLLPVWYALYDTAAPVICGDIPRTTLMEVFKKKQSQSLEKMRSQLSSVKLSEDAHSYLGDIIKDAHCGALPHAMISPFIELHQLRDLSLAQSVTQEGSVLLTGSMHARKDIGAPLFLEQSFPETPLLSIAIFEVEDSKTEARAYLPVSYNEEQDIVYDYLIFTPVISIDDPCEKFSQMIHHIKEKYKHSKGKVREENSSRNE